MYQIYMVRGCENDTTSVERKKTEPLRKIDSNILSGVCKGNMNIYITIYIYIYI